MAVIDDALATVRDGDTSAQLRTDFSACLEKGGVASVYAVADRLDALRLPLLYPYVAEHFVHARIPPKELTKRDRSRAMREHRRVAKTLLEASEAAQAVSLGSAGWTHVGRSLHELSAEANRIADEADDAPLGSPGRSMKISTRLALRLDGLLSESELPMTRRCQLIAEVVSAFIEPVTGEQIRQRLKDLRRRPPRLS